MDLGMEPGVDFVEQIDEAVGSCRLLIAVIGPHWTSALDAQGRRRLDDPADFVRVEVEAGLRQPGVRVIPVLVQGATMPRADALPDGLSDLARRNALELSDARWRYDVERLIAAAQRVLDPPGRPSPAPPVGEDAALGRPRWKRRLAIAVPAVAVAAGVIAIVSRGGGEGGAAPKTGALAAIPAAVRDAGCHRAEGEDFWMKGTHRAVEQYDCPRLPAGVLSDARAGGSVSYGLFATGEDAREFVERDFRSELERESRPCGEVAAAELEAQYAGGDAECYRNDEGITINWTYRGSPVAAQLYLAPGTTVDAAVDARAKLL